MDDFDINSENSEHEHSEEEECDHLFDGGACLHCGILTMCELCDREPWDTRCDICDGGNICIKCYAICKKCTNKLCIVCQQDLLVEQTCPECS